MRSPVMVLASRKSSWSISCVLGTTNKVAGVTCRALSILKMIALLVILLPLPACALSGDTIEGRVLEASTNNPIPDTIVVARWIGYISSFADSKTVCYHVLSATTDSNGHYSMPAWRKKMTEEWQKNLTPREVKIDVYKAGYEWAGMAKTEQGVSYFKKYTGSNNARLKELIRILESTRCGTKDSSEHNLHELYTALYEEGKVIATSPSELDIIDTLHYWAGFVLFDPSKPSGRDEKGRLVNIDQLE
jgi:hypothetical protein